MTTLSFVLCFYTMAVVVAFAPTYEEEEQVALLSDIRSLFSPAPGGRFENRVGFEFASMELDEYVHGVGDEEPTLAGTSDRIRNFAQILLQHPLARVHIDAHCGLSAPPMIAQGFSEERARIVASELESLGVPEERITTAGWGMTITRAALTSSHPNSVSAKSGYGWAEIFLIIDSAASRKPMIMPPRPDYYADLAPAPHESTRSQQSAHEERFSAVSSITASATESTYPIFYMEPGTTVGADVALHFFEPRYRLLVRRAWKSNKRFLYCSDPPFSKASEGGLFDLPLEAATPKDNCVMVVIDDVDFYPDGRADIRGRGVKRINLRSVSLEDGTGGLFSASITPTTVSELSYAESAQADPKIQKLVQTEAARAETKDNIVDALLQLARELLLWLWPEIDTEFPSMFSQSPANVATITTTSPTTKKQREPQAKNEFQLPWIDTMSPQIGHVFTDNVNQNRWRRLNLGALGLVVLVSSVAILVVVCCCCCSRVSKKTQAPLLQVDVEPFTPTESFTHAKSLDSDVKVAAARPMLAV